MHSSSQCCPHQCTYHLFGLGDLKDVADVDSGVDWNWPWPWQIVHPRAVALKYILFVCFFVSSRTPQTWRTFDVRIQSLQLRDREEEDQTPAWFFSNWLTFVFPLLHLYGFVKIVQLYFYPHTCHIYLEHIFDVLAIKTTSKMRDVGSFADSLTFNVFAWMTFIPSE